MKYYVSIAGRTVEVDLSGEVPLIDGEAVAVSLDTVAGTQIRSVLMGGESSAIVAEPGEGRGKWTLTVGGQRVPVEVVDQRARALRELTGSAATSAAKTLTAPMPGMVLRVEVEVGQAVKAGQGVLIVEAMKMENELKAPADGIVTQISVEPGRTVEKGAILVTFGAPAAAPEEDAG